MITLDLEGLYIAFHSFVKGTICARKEVVNK